MSSPSFRLNPDLDAGVLGTVYRRDGRVRVHDFLMPDDAARLHKHLSAREDWRQILNSGDKVFELDRATRAGMTDTQRSALDDGVMAGVRDGFQYRYESIRVSDAASARRTAADVLNDFAIWLSGPEPLAFLRHITGAGDIVFADAQATAYSPGDLLTAHDDEVAGKDRRAAYVLGLNPRWRPEWGGILLFHDDDSSVSGSVPAFNTLDILSVPQPHSVSMVTRAAPDRRYSITGWLRAQPQPA
ncbi:2OG-Fe(II) oxygenase [Sphingomonas mollis]|uniref:2OG-Fe(II) oxygenase n=1 Tax=Sphingomonas mollis TaxID=2795726 RepID=A0ABS0XJN5_9SPHN|nr:2OG-Fe(II) oxygenase family protein [Sphingomonas sp. BT553]MBJ6120246.1 2OG-Fe(II) oxygenase [Sphingomonas sp. BT553]